MPRFDLGQVSLTSGIQEALERHPAGNGMEELIHMIYNRHAEADWCNDGDLDPHDIDANERALEPGGHLFSVYYLKDGTDRGTKIFCITEWDRSVTTALLPEEY